MLKNLNPLFIVAIVILSVALFLPSADVASIPGGDWSNPHTYRGYACLLWGTVGAAGGFLFFIFAGILGILQGKSPVASAGPIFTTWLIAISLIPLLFGSVAPLLTCAAIFEPRQKRLRTLGYFSLPATVFGVWTLDLEGFVREVHIGFFLWLLCQALLLSASIYAARSVDTKQG